MMVSRSCPHICVELFPALPPLLPAGCDSARVPAQVTAAWAGLGDTDRLRKGQQSPCSPARFQKTP